MTPPRAAGWPPTCAKPSALVTTAEERLKSVETALSDPSSYNGDLASLGREHATLLAEVESLTARWAALAEVAEGAA